jgi:hypothetical protein
MFKTNFKEELIMKTIGIVILTILLCTASACAGVVGNTMEVRIVTDDGRTLPTYPVTMRHGVRKVYAEAVKGDHYRIEVKNRLNRRVGVVIAIDGRNIISGDKSWLKSNERMYILEPHGSGEFSGWRTAQDRVNRFYFTDVSESYAAAFGDESAMGVIAVAMFPEVRRCKPPIPFPQTTAPSPRVYEEKAAGSANKEKSAADRAGSSELVKDQAAKSEQTLESAGTGYGRDEYSPSEVVAFEPENRAVETIYLKYEWRSTLCKLGVVKCTGLSRLPSNRLWNNNDYAPPPPLYDHF